MKTRNPLLFSILLGSSLSLTAMGSEVQQPVLPQATRQPASEVTVSGKVLDLQGQPLVGVSILVEGTRIGTITDNDGSFTLRAPRNNAVLHVSYVGYNAQDVTVPAGNKPLTIYLKDNAVQLNETVVVGYGTQKKVDLTGAISTIGEKELKNRISPSLGYMLQGTIPGLNITTSSGVPGSSPSINVRGYTSINGASPLILIDGAEGDINRINPNDVASISVIKDASAAAIYGARAAFGVILVTTKSGATKNGKATVQYSGRFGWKSNTTSTDYETRGYWSVYTVNKFWQAANGTNYVDYTDKDMEELKARVNDKTENPARPWTVVDERNGRKQWVYYGNYDWWHMLFRDNHPTQQHDLSISGGNNDIKYLLSGQYERENGILKQHPDVFQRYNLRSKIDFRVNPYIRISNNTSFYGGQYKFLGDGSIQNLLAYSARHALANFPMKNPDGSWLYSTPYLKYKIANGRHIMLGDDSHRNVQRTTDFTNMTQVVITPVKSLSLTADFTYRLYQNRNTARTNPYYYREVPDGPLLSYATGAGQNELDESVNTYNYYAANAYASYDNTFNGIHHLSGVVGFNYETRKQKNVSAMGQFLLSPDLDDLNLVGVNSDGAAITGVGGGQNEYALAGIFGRINYDYKNRYLIELSGRYDGTSRFGKGHQWGWFPSGSIGWRMSEEPFFKPLRNVIDNLKLRGSFGSLGNQNVSSYYTFARLITTGNLGYTFGEGSVAPKYTNIGAPVSDDMTWETVQQWDLGLDLALLDNRLNITADGYIRNTLNMLTDGVELPSVYGTSVPDMNAANLQTKGYEVSATWNDNFTLLGKPFTYSVGFNISNYRSYITKYDNADKTFAKSYYKGMRIGEIWGYVVDGYFKSDDEAKAYAKEVDLSAINNPVKGGWGAGDLKFVDLDGDHKIGIGANTVDNPGDRKILGNSLPSLNYGFNLNASWYGFDVSTFFQGTGNHYWYPDGQSMPFWGTYSYPYLTYLPVNFLDRVWSPENPDAYFPRALAYSSSSGPLSYVNNRYLQNIRYLRFKNLTVGYTIPYSVTSKIGIRQLRVYFSGENLCYWSPLKKNSKYVDPEAAIHRSGVANNAYYPWSKTFMFGIDITF